jgi:hypothetical protein
MGRFHGRGKLSYVDGSVVTGEFYNDMFHGDAEERALNNLNIYGVCAYLESALTCLPFVPPPVLEKI